MANPDHSVVYLTGAPASGKSRLVKELTEVISPLFVFSYANELTQFLSDRRNEHVTHRQLRESSSSLVQQADIQALDNYLVKEVTQQRAMCPVIIDSHSVTKEAYGFRITPFSLDLIRKLAPTHIVMLFADPVTTCERIRSDPQGRQPVTEYAANLHTGLQSSVALMYMMHLGITTYCLDSTKPCEELVEWLKSMVFQSEQQETARPP